MGHLFLPRVAGDDFEGTCPYHGACWEGLASGPAIEARWGRPGSDLPPDHEAWALEARYLALGVANLVLTLSPQRVILGGGVMQQAHLFPRVRAEVLRLLNRYVPLPALGEEIDAYLVPPALGDRAGVLGALALAQDASGVGPSTAPPVGAA